MTPFDPDDLTRIERMLRNTRAVADDDTLDRMRPRTQRSARPAATRTPRRTLAIGFATVFSMVALTGGAAAAMFGHVPLLHKSSKSAPAAMSAKSLSKMSAAKSSSTALALLGSSLGSLKATAKPAAAGGTVGAKAIITPAATFPSLFPNAGNFQYLLRQLICRFLREFGLNRFANRLGCPP